MATYTNYRADAAVYSSDTTVEDWLRIMCPKDSFQVSMVDPILSF